MEELYKLTSYNLESLLSTLIVYILENCDITNEDAAMYLIENKKLLATSYCGERFDNTKLIENIESKLGVKICKVLRKFSSIVVVRGYKVIPVNYTTLNYKTVHSNTVYEPLVDLTS